MSFGETLGVSVGAEAKLSAGGASVETISLWPSSPCGIEGLGFLLP